jgi:hypothetical protein
MTGRTRMPFSPAPSGGDGSPRDLVRLDGGPDLDAEFTPLPDLASRRLGCAVIDANDDFFGDRASLVMPCGVPEVSTGL